MNHLLNFKGRIVSASILLLVLSMAILAYLTHQKMYHLAVQDVNKYSMLRVSSSAEKIHTFVRRVGSDITQASHMFSNRRGEAEVMEWLKKVDAMSDATAVVVGFEDGIAYNSKKGKYDATSYDPRVRGWYKSAKAKRKTIITDIYVGKATGALMISIATPFYDGGSFSGVLLADLELTALEPMVNQAVFDGAIAGLYDANGMTIASNGEVDVPGKTRLSDFAELAELEQVITRNDEGSHEYQLQGVEKVAYFKSIHLDDETTWHLLVGLEKEKVYKVLNESVRTSVITTFTLVLISAGVIYLFLTIAYKPLLALKDTARELSQGNGDLTKRLPVTANDDLGQISRDINTFIESLQSIMLEVADTSKSIGGSIDGLQGLTQENRRVLDEHKAETEKAVSALDEMSATSHDVARNTAEAVEFTGNTNAQTNESRVAVSGASQTVLQLVKKVEEASLQINQMGGDIAEISNVLKVIGEIAEQTNLLALNAAIEAARAGDHGRGFAVVADEVRALASRTQDSTTEIHNTINKLIVSSESVINAMVITKESGEQASEQANQVVEDLDNISISVGEINNLNMQIANATEQQSSVAGEITKNMSKMSGMVERVAESGEEVESQATTLASANAQLANIVGKFKLQ